MEFNRVWAIGRDTYVRFWPNPGIGVCFGKWRVALSWRGGFEVFKAHPKVVWLRKYSLFSRVKRPSLARSK